MKVLVTGAAGFIGATTAEALLAKGHEVVGIDNLTSGTAENVPRGATFVEGNCGDEHLIRSLGRFDACIHFAARIAPGESMQHPEAFFANNVGASFGLLRALIETGTPRFVFSSSCAVYGNQVEMPIDESRSINPTSPYGETKWMVEVGLRWLAQQGRIRAASMRYFNAAGATPGHPERHRPEIHLIPIAFDAATGRRPYLEIYGSDYPTPDGTCVRDYIHVADLAEAHVLAIDALDRNDHLTLNLGTGSGHSNREVIEAVQRVTKTAFEVRYGNRRPGDPASAVASNELARSTLGWLPRRTDIETIIQDAWEAHQR